MSKNQLPPLSGQCGESGMRKAQQRRGFPKVSTRLQALMSLYKPMQRIASANIRHTRSCLSCSAVACATHTLLGTPDAGTIQEQQGVCRDKRGSAGRPFQAGFAGLEPPFGLGKAGTTVVDGRLFPLQLHLL